MRIRRKTARIGDLCWFPVEVALLLVCICVLSNWAAAQSTRSTLASTHPFTAEDWTEVDRSISRATQWIASTQQPNGSFPTVLQGQPGVTSLGILAILAQGQLPSEGEDGAQLSRAIEYVLSTQKPSGLLAAVGPRGEKISYNVTHSVGQTAVYNHAISALMLSEVYATTSSERSERIQQAIEQALQVTLGEQRRPKRREADRGGWRYLDVYGSQDADLSVIGWHLMFLRSAKNSGFDVPATAIDDAVACVRRHFIQGSGRFGYTPNPRSSPGSRAMTGAGILALSHAGLHKTPEARNAGETLRGFSFARYNNSDGGLDRYHYSLFQCTQAAYQLGDDNWEHFYPPTFRTLLANQNTNGSWAAENVRLHTDAMYGSVYTTALVVLSLSAPNQLLPIFQR